MICSTTILCLSKTYALFAWLISRTFSANEQYFSLTTNQPIVLSAMAYQPSEQGNGDMEERRLFTLGRYEEQEEIDSWQPGTAS